YVVVLDFSHSASFSATERDGLSSDVPASATPCGVRWAEADRSETLEAASGVGSGKRLLNRVSLGRELCPVSTEHLKSATRLHHYCLHCVDSFLQLPLSYIG